MYALLQVEGLYQLEQSCATYQNATPNASSANKAKNLIANCDQMVNGPVGGKPTAAPSSMVDFNGIYVDYIVQMIFSFTFYAKTTVYTVCESVSGKYVAMINLVMTQ